MRDFARTQEPRGSAKKLPKSAQALSFVVQKHDARNLHYDFRLELDGVLLSWAVPKGPSLDPGVKRLAMEVEPHPLEYGGFEGTIPKAEYGGGTVMVWDRGTWTCDGDAQKALAKGHLSFSLSGQKLKGAWHLVRTKRLADDHHGNKAGKGWLLFKSRDEQAREDDTLLSDEPNSALTGRNLDQIARAEGEGAGASEGAPDSRPRRKLPATKAKKSQATLPSKVSPELATLVDAAPDGDDWVHEIKLDGYRILARLDHGQVTLLTRNGKDWTERMPTLQAALEKLEVEQAILDGELVSLDPNGVSHFQTLQTSLNAESDAALVYYAFDLLHLDGEDTTGQPLLERKSLLRKLLTGSEKALNGTVRFSAHVVGSGPDFFGNACKLGLEGTIAKRSASTYRGGRGRDWLKIKCGKAQEFTIVGYSEPSGVITHPDKVVYPELGITKQEVLDYYALVAERMLPHIANRPLTLVRCPNGRGKPCFFQKHPGEGTPAGMRSVSIREKEGKAPYTVIDDATGLFGLVQLGALEIHTWGSRADDFEHPDLLVFDLDPDPLLEYTAVIAGAYAIREVFQQARLETFVKTTGGKGLHVCVPIAPELDWEQVKAFTGQVAQALALRSPELYVATQSKAQRTGKIFIDYLRNGRGATFIAPYSTRARENAPLAIPLDWDELSPKLLPNHFNLRNVQRRLEKLQHDPFERMPRVKQRLPTEGIEK